MLSWFRSYLSNRQRRVVIDEQCSIWMNIEAVVPQGSVLSPFHFTWAICGSASQGFLFFFNIFLIFLSMSRNGNYCIVPSGFAKLTVINMLIFMRAFFLRFPDRLMKLFEVNCSFLDKLTH